MLGFLSVPGGQKSLDFVNFTYGARPHNAAEHRYYRRWAGAIVLPVLPE
ncbi:MAG: hypothetical protein U1E41_10310 [Paracoccus sp. (in: a-proteobacteria)]